LGPVPRYTAAEQPVHFIEVITRLLNSGGVRNVIVPAGTPRTPAEHEFLQVQDGPRIIVGVSGAHHLLVPDRDSSRECCLGEGEAAFFPPGVWNIPLRQAALEFISVVFLPDYTRLLHGRWNGRAGSRFLNVYHHTPRPIRGMVAPLLEALNLAGATVDPSPRLLADMVGVTLRALCGELHRAAEPVARAHYKWQAISRFLHEHLSEPLSLATVGEHFGLHPNHVCRLFRQEGQERFVDYLTRLRIERSLVLLQQGNVPIEDVAVTCGFRDAGYFRKVFKARTGRRPADFRAERQHPGS
jgi:AraC-like DNA-binding protein